jgi:hypothetical protein
MNRAAHLLVADQVNLVTELGQLCPSVLLNKVPYKIEPVPLRYHPAQSLIARA